MLDDKFSDAKAPDAKAPDAKASDANASDANASDANASDANASDANASDAKASDAKASVAKASDVQASDAKASDIQASDLERFVVAQAGGVFEQAVDEVRAGRKHSHWMWFIYPQLRGLGRSERSAFYGLEHLDEARRFAAHPILGPRIREAAEAALAAPEGLTADEVFGPIDAAKLRSSMTLFGRAAPHDEVFGKVLDRYFEGREDPMTGHLLGRAP